MTTEFNPDDKQYTKRAYHVQIGYYLSFDAIVYADNEQDCIDLIVDSWEETKADNEGYFLDMDSLEDEESEQYIYGGSHCRYLSFTYDELRITEV